MLVDELLRRFEEDTRWLEAHYEELRSKFKEEWIAIYGKEIIDHDKDLESLVERLKAKYPEDFRNFVIEFLTEESGANPVIRGFFEGGTPFVLAFLRYEKFGIFAPLKLLIDTGASRTVIMDKDVMR